MPIRSLACTISHGSHCLVCLRLSIEYGFRAAYSVVLRYANSTKLSPPDMLYRDIARLKYPQAQLVTLDRAAQSWMLATPSFQNFASKSRPDPHWP